MGLYYIWLFPKLYLTNPIFVADANQFINHVIIPLLLPTNNDSTSLSIICSKLGAISVLSSTFSSKLGTISLSKSTFTSFVCKYNLYKYLISALCLSTLCF